MQAHTKSIFDLFEQTRRYVVPLFQRQYVWSAERQLEPLWEDVLDKVEDRLAGREPDPHFLGAIVLSQITSFGEELLAHDIIDGQQRLTTFQILLAAIRHLMQERGEPSMAANLIHFTRNLGPMEFAAEAYKVWPTAADQGFLKTVLDARGREDVEKVHPPTYHRKKLQPRPAIIEAYLYFYDAIAAFLDEAGLKTVTERLKAIHQVLYKSMLIVSIELEGRDDPQVIFETLNARGEPLLPSDLLRNFIFLRASRKNEQAKELYGKYWAPFDSTQDRTGGYFWKVEERQGRNKRARLDLFMQHFLVLKTEKEVNLTKLYQTYKTWITATGPYTSVEAELVDLATHARTFATFFDSKSDSRMGQFLDRLRLIDTSTVYPLLLLLGQSSLAQSELDGIAADLESYLIRRYVCQLTIKNYNQFFPALIKHLRTAGVTRESLEGFLLDPTGDAGRWPRDDEFRKAWLDRQVYTGREARRVEMILRALEAAMHTAMQEKVKIVSDLTVEHVMPQSWYENWPLSDSPSAVSDDDSPEALRRDRALHTLGNLTLLTQELNSSVSNAGFAARRAEIVKQSTLLLNAYFQDRTAWDVDSIEERGRHLFELACVVWPHPGRVAAPTVAMEVVVPTATPSGHAAEFMKVETHEHGQATTPSLGYAHFSKLVGNPEWESALIAACLCQGYLIKVVVPADILAPRPAKIRAPRRRTPPGLMEAGVA